MRRAFSISFLLILVFTLFGGSTALAVDPTRTSRPVPAAIDDTRLDQPVTSGVARPTVLDASLLSATGVRQVVVRLTRPSVGEVAATGAGAAAQVAALGAVRTQQTGFIGSADADVLAQTEIALNAVVLEVDAARLTTLAANPAVASISPVIDYALDLSETVPYIGATAVHTAGFDGSGVTVAVLDSGIDYTHEAFGDYATVEDYDAAYGANTSDPANKTEPDWAAIADHTNIVGGFDFVGETWPTSDQDVRPDPDPIDCGGKDVDPDPGDPPDPDALCAGGHGTHVADILGGINGVAPGVEMHAVKVCSAVSTACSGVALLLGMDYALDPNADGVTDDHVDVINMSLGSPYGQARDDDLAAAVETATDVGVLTVAAAGNSADKPYVSGSPAAAPSAISVAQTAVPSDVLPLLTVESPAAIAGNYPAVFQPWSEPLEVEGAILDTPLQFGDGAGGNLDGCAAFADGTLAGLVVLVNRGTCDFSLKIANIAAGDAEAGIIAMVQPGDPFTGALGACPDDLCEAIPGFMISQANGNLLKANEPAPGVVVSLDPATGLPLVGTMVGSSSRGPSMLTNSIKPEIGAPGASLSAEAGTGTDTTPFGGTSGATPMIAGSAALLLDAFDTRSPAEIKSLLMNYAETEIFNGAPDAPINSALAAIQRIGAGEVRVDQSLEGSDYAAWDTELQTGALSFGFVDATDELTTLSREVTVANYSGAEATFDISSSFRFANDVATGGVSLALPPDVTVPAGGTEQFTVELDVDGQSLLPWTANSGLSGANPAPFNLLEYDGYIELTPEVGEPLHLAWHVLPRLSGETTASDDTVVIDEEFDGVPSGSVQLSNAGVGLTGIDGYSLVGESPELPAAPEGSQLPTIDLRYAGVQTIPVPAGFCSGSDSFLLLLAVNTWERQTHANAPAAFEWDLDTDGDGEADFAVFNLDAAGNLSDGRNLAFVDDLGDPDAAVAFFGTDHGTNSANTVLTLCGEQIGMNASDFFAPITADLFAVDTYFTGRATDMITGIEFAPLGERYFPVVGDDGFGSGDVPAGGSATLNVMDFGPDGTNPSELGVLLFTDGARSGFRAGAPQSHETIVLSVEQGEAPPPPPPGDLPFDDIEDSPFVGDIVWAFENGVTGGCSTDPPLYCPNANVTREQMATFLDRILDLPATSTDFFGDDDTSIHEGAINRLAAAGITGGCGSGTFCPKASVLREQMASFLVRAFDLPNSAVDLFTDDEGNQHENDINALAAAGITAGCGPSKYCPKNPVTRGQMAAFLHRAVED